MLQAIFTNITNIKEAKVSRILVVKMPDQVSVERVAPIWRDDRHYPIESQEIVKVKVSQPQFLSPPSIGPARRQILEHR
jgi:hypothetical protein